MKNKYFLIIAAFVVLFVTMNALVKPNFFRVHDFTQGARNVEMYRAVRDGQVPARWSKNFGYGYGMPTFLFYAPLPYMVGAFSYWIIGDLIVSLKVIWAIPSILSFVGMYLYTKKYFGRLGALVAATSFTLAPYRAVDLYVRGAIGEVWAIASFPWILRSIDLWMNERKKIDLNVVCWTAFLFLSHNLMTMFFTPVILFYITLQWLSLKKKNVTDLFWGYVQVALSIGCAAFYLFPAFLEKGATQVEHAILSGYFSYTLHFLYIRQFFTENWKYGGSTWGPEDDISFFLGYGQLAGLMLLAVGILMMGVSLSRKKGFLTRLPEKIIASPMITLSIIFLPLSLFMATLKSQFIWNLLPLLQTAQFPWRFLSLSMFFLAILNGWIFQWKLPNKLRYVMAGVLLCLLVIPSWKYYQPEKFLEEESTFYYTDEHRIRFEMSDTWADFLPNGIDENIKPTDQRFHILADPGAEEAVEILVDRSHQLLVKTNFATPQLVTFHIANFPGWQVYVQNKRVDFTPSVDSLIEVMVPAGDQTVAVNLERTQVRFFADLITVLSLGTLIAKGVHDTRNRS